MFVAFSRPLGKGLLWGLWNDFKKHKNFDVKTLGKMKGHDQDGITMFVS